MGGLKDKFWIWGHSPNSCDSYNVGTSDYDVTPAECARYFGAGGVFYVPFGHKMDIDGYLADTEGVERIGFAVEDWGVSGTDQLEKTLELTKKHANTDRLVFDDFFNEKKREEPYHPYWEELTVKDLLAMRDKIHKAGYEMWVVLYQHQCTDEKLPYLDVFDGITFWFWSEPSVVEYHKGISWFLEHSVGKRRLVGCYLFNFGLSSPATPSLVRYQLDCNKLLIEQGELDGVILHNNALGGKGLAAYEAARLWMRENGNAGI